MELSKLDVEQATHLLSLQKHSTPSALSSKTSSTFTFFQANQYILSWATKEALMLWQSTSHKKFKHETQLVHQWCCGEHREGEWRTPGCPEPTAGCGESCLHWAHTHTLCSWGPSGATAGHGQAEKQLEEKLKDRNTAVLMSVKASVQLRDSGNSLARGDCYSKLNTSVRAVLAGVCDKDFLAALEEVP